MTQYILITSCWTLLLSLQFLWPFIKHSSWNVSHLYPYYRSSLLFPMNISRTFITWLEGRKQKLVWFLHFVTVTDCKKNISLPLRSYCTNPGLCGGTVSHVTNSSASAELFLHPNKSNFAARDDKFVKHLWEVVKQHATLGKNRLSSDIPHFGENLCFSAHAAKMLY